MKLRHSNIVTRSILLVGAVSLLTCAQMATLSADQRQIIGSWRVKPIDRQTQLSEIIFYECPARLKTTKGRSAERRRLHAEFDRSLCGMAKKYKRTMVMRYGYCRGKLVFSWRVSPASCKL